MPVSAPVSARSRITEDIALHPQPVVTAWTITRRWRASRKKQVSGAVPGVLPRTRLGPNILTFVVLAKYRLNLPHGKIVDNLRLCFGLTVSEKEGISRGSFGPSSRHGSPNFPVSEGFTGRMVDRRKFLVHTLSSSSMNRAISLSSNGLPLTHRARRLAAGFLIVGAASGAVAFLAGGGIRELLTAPRYQPTLPSATNVTPDVLEERLRWLSREPLAATPSSTTRAGAPAKSMETADRGSWIRIPALSIDVPLAAPRTMEADDILRALQVGVVRYANGVEPGQPGVLAVAGHSTGEPWKGRYRFAFLNARKLRPGDAILVDHGGTRYTYRVTGQQTINPALTPFLETSAERPKLTLITCWPLWTTSERLAIEADLAETAPLIVRASS